MMEDRASKNGAPKLELGTSGLPVSTVDKGYYTTDWNNIHVKEQ